MRYLHLQGLLVLRTWYLSSLYLCISQAPSCCESQKAKLKALVKTAYRILGLGTHDCNLSLPPPPRYPNQNHAYNSTAAEGVATTTPTNMEIHNVLTHPVGIEYQLVVGEGRLLVLLQSSTFANPHRSHTHPGQ